MTGHPQNRTAWNGERGELLGGLGFFLSQAGKYRLLSAEREKELGRSLWKARRSLERAIREARAAGRKTGSARREEGPSRRPLSGRTRLRLLAVEFRARRLLSRLAGEATPPQPVDGRRPRPSIPNLTPDRIRSIAPVLRKELGRIRGIKEEFVCHNLRLVVWVAKAFRGRGLDLVDLVQEGSLGLLRAIDRFDPALGHRFSTYATHWVRQGILRALAEKARAIRLPLSRLPQARGVKEATARLTKQLGREPTFAEVATEVGVERNTLEELLPALSPIDSLDAPLASAGVRTADRLIAPTPSPLDEAIERETVRLVQSLLLKMPARERAVLAMRYGIGRPRESSLEEIGSSLGLCRERIRQIEKLALERLRSLVRGGESPLGSRGPGGAALNPMGIAALTPAPTQAQAAPVQALRRATD